MAAGSPILVFVQLRPLRGYASRTQAPPSSLLEVSDLVFYVSAVCKFFLLPLRRSCDPRLGLTRRRCLLLPMSVLTVEDLHHWWTRGCVESLWYTVGHDGGD
jgi:hypothetical protein